MKMQMLASDRLERVRSGTTRSVNRWARWAWQGIVEVGHNSLAVLGLVCIGVVLFFSSDSALRLQVERQALEWLNLRHGVATATADESENLLAELAEPEAIARATARDPSALPREQALVVSWLARRYRVAPEPVASLVQEAWTIGKKAKVDPTLILAIVAIESSFNPFAQSPVGAQGLMQVMTRVHDEKYSAFGGKLAAFDPVANLRVGTQILGGYIGRAEGNIELALKHYVGAANLPDDGGYAERVLAEQGFLRAVAGGQTVAWNAPNTRPPAPAAPEAQLVAVANKPGAATAPSTVVSARSSASLPAAPTATATVMAPAIGIPLAANLSAATGNVAATAAAPADKAPAPQRQAAPAAHPAAAVQPAVANVPGTVTMSSTTPAAAKAPAAPASAAASTEPAVPKAKPDTAPATGSGRVALVDGAVR